MKRRFVDLSIYLENDVISDPPPFGPKIQYHKHDDTAGQIAGFVVSGFDASFSWGPAPAIKLDKEYAHL